MGIEIAKIENSALKEAALQIDNQGCKNNFIDDFEINLFEAKAIELLIDKKCTLQEFATLFPTSDINQEDSYMNVDSVKITQSQPNKLEVLKMDEQDLVKKIEELQNEIKVKKEELQNFKKDADILIKAYSNPVIDLVAGLAGSSAGAGVGIAGLALAMTEAPLAIAASLLALPAILVAGVATDNGVKRGLNEVFLEGEKKEMFNKVIELQKNNIKPLEKEIAAMSKELKTLNKELENLRALQIVQCGE